MRLQVSAYIPGVSPVHTCDARAKVALLVVYTAAIFWVDTFLGMALFALAVVGVLGVSRIAPVRLLRMGVPVYVLAVLTVAFAAFNPATGLAVGCLYAARIVLLLLASLLVTFTTTSTQLVAALTWFLRPLRAVRFPVDDAAMVLSLAIRFIPLTALEFCQVHDAQEARGAQFAAGSVMVRFLAWGNVFVPVLVQLFRRADKLSVAMDSRCYGLPDARRTALGRLRADAASLAALVVGSALLVVVAAFL